MDSFYTRLQVICDPDFSEILMAEIAEAGFDSFLETEKGFEAYVESEKYDNSIIQAIRKKYDRVQPLIFFQDRVQKKNWNEEWEKNLQPIVVDDKCLIRAEFHQVPQRYQYEIVITPKMSFGTGHHQTTYLMVRNQMEMNFNGKRVMDAGCGTGILSIMASKLGAAEVDAFDIDEWSILNATENIATNQCRNIRIRQGKVTDLSWTRPLDIILANINKNILMDEMKHYSSLLAKKGMLLLSGFYASDIADLTRETSRFGLAEVRRDERETWAALLLQKE